MLESSGHASVRQNARTELHRYRRVWLTRSSARSSCDSPSAAEARAAVLATGATPLRDRRLQNDCLLDTADMMLRQQRSALRVRMESGRSLLTFKGPVAARGDESA